MQPKKKCSLAARILNCNILPFQRFYKGKLSLYPIFINPLWPQNGPFVHIKRCSEIFSFLAIVIHAFKYKEKHIIHTGFPWLKLNKMWRFNKFTFLLSCLLNKHIEKAKKNRNNAWKIIFMIDVENLVTFKINVLIAIKSLNLMLNQINLKWIWICN